MRTETDRRKVVAYLTLWELGESRAMLREMGEVLPEPVPRSQEAFADLIYALGDPRTEGRSYRHLRVLDGGPEGSVVGRRPGPEDAASAVVGGKPSRVASAQPETHPTDLAGEGQGDAGPRRACLEPNPTPAPTTSTEEN